MALVNSLEYGYSCQNTQVGGSFIASLLLREIIVVVSYINGNCI